MNQMTLQEFISSNDKENAIILLEGKREVLEADKEKLEVLGRLLAMNTSKMIFRSGNASGADLFFSRGVITVDSARMQVITPYSGHRQKTNQANQTYSLTDIDLSYEEEVVFQSKGNKKIEKLINLYVAGDRNPLAMKAAYIIRDTIKVIGTVDIKPATFGIFYDDLKKPNSGGTGHTMSVCKLNNIPFVNQNVWFEWLKK